MLSVAVTFVEIDYETSAEFLFPKAADFVDAQGRSKVVKKLLQAPLSAKALKILFASVSQESKDKFAAEMIMKFSEEILGAVNSFARDNFIECELRDLQAEPALTRNEENIVRKSSLAVRATIPSLSYDGLFEKMLPRMVMSLKDGNELLFYLIGKASIKNALRNAIASVPPDEQEEIITLFARHYRERLTEWLNSESRRQGLICETVQFALVQKN